MVKRSFFLMAFAVIVAFAFSVQAEEEKEPEVLWGKQTKGWGHSKNAETDGNKVELDKAAKITKVEGNAKKYCIWSDGVSVKCGAEDKSIEGDTLPAGTYSVLPGLSKGQRSAEVRIHMKYSSPESESDSDSDEKKD
ncbi:MAG: hypothetical protein R6V10_14365 [bacterium]